MDNGGTFSSSGTGAIRAIGGASLIGPITNNARFEIPGSTVILTGDLKNTNQVRIGDASTGGVLLYDIDTTLDGMGEVIMSDKTTNSLNAVFNTSGRLTNVGNTIRGSGLIGGRVTNQATIRADQATPLIFQTSDIAGGGVNTGLMEATGIGTLRLHISTVENAGGEVKSTDGGTVLLTGSATIQGGNVNVVGQSRLELSEGTVDANLKNSSQGTIATVFGSNNFLSGSVENPNGGTILVNNGTRLKLDGSSTYNNAGTIRLDGVGPLAGFGGTRIMNDDSVVLKGGGEIAMSNSVSNTIEALSGNPGVDMFINEDHWIHGSGNIGRNVLQVVNRGTIEANLPFVDTEAWGTIAIDPGGAGLAGTFTNESILRATGGGRLQLVNGRYINTGGLIEANAGSTIDMEQAVTIEGGTIRTNGSGIVNVNGEVTLDGVGMTIDADMKINQPQGRVNWIGDISNQKTITIDRSSIRTQGTVDLSGGGNIVLVDDPNSRLDVFPDSIPDRLINIDNTISGAGTIANLSIENRGTMRADGANTLFYFVPASGFDNQGTLQVSGAGGMQIIGGPFTTSGNVDIAASSELVRNGNYIQTAGNTNVNGTLEVTFGNSIQIQGGTLTGSGDVIGPTTVTNVAPGNSPGILNFTNTAEILFGIDIELGGDQVDGLDPDARVVNTGNDPTQTLFDQINVFDTLTLADGLLIGIELVPGYRPQVGDFFDILTGDSIQLLGSVQVQSLSSPSYDHEFLTLFDPDSQSNRDVLRLTVTVVPEPSPLLLLALLAVFGTKRGRRGYAVGEGLMRRV